jgi:hypothetical protein
MSNIILNEEELKIMKEVKANEKTIEKSGVEKTIKKLIQTPNNFDTFSQTLNNVLQSYPEMLNEFTNKYIAYKRYPGNNSNNDFYSVLEKMKGLDTLVSQTTTNIQEETQKLNTLVNAINQILNLEKTDNQLLKKELDLVGQEIYGSHEMIGDFVDDYKRTRLENVLLLVGTIYLFFYVAYQLYKRWKP